MFLRSRSRRRHGVRAAPDHEALDGLVLGDGLGRRGAAHSLDVAPAVLVPAVVSPLDGHPGEATDCSVLGGPLRGG